MTGCVFCSDNWKDLTILAKPIEGIAVVRPLDPVTPGHVLVISDRHTDDAAENPEVFADLAYTAAEWVAQEGIQANIITSIGPNATQSVFHTHVHVVPRTPSDRLPLPWTPQHEVKSLERAHALRQSLIESGSPGYSTGMFQQAMTNYYEMPFWSTELGPGS